MSKRQHKDKTKMLRRNFAAVLNMHSREGRSNTPDFVLAKFMIDVLRAGEELVNDREAWHKASLIVKASAPIVLDGLEHEVRNTPHEVDDSCPAQGVHIHQYGVTDESSIYDGDRLVGEICRCSNAAVLHFHVYNNTPVFQSE